MSKSSLDNVKKIIEIGKEDYKAVSVASIMIELQWVDGMEGEVAYKIALFAYNHLYHEIDYATPTGVGAFLANYLCYHDELSFEEFYEKLDDKVFYETLIDDYIYSDWQ